MSEHVQRGSEGAADKRGWLDGRASRREYWLWTVLSMVAATLVGLMVPSAALLVVFPTGLALFLVTIRRFHDFGWSGFLVVAMNVGFGLLSLALKATLDPQTAAFVTLPLSLLALIAVGAWPGQPFANRYGPPPRGKDVSEVFS